MTAVDAQIKRRSTKQERRMEVLQYVAGMLNEAELDKITTARIANAMDISEGLLYRYFKSKAEMFGGLIDFIEESLMGLAARIREMPNMSGLAQARATVNVMLQFANANRGLTRVMTGQVLVYEDAKLNERIVHLHATLEGCLKMNLRVAVAAGELPADFDVSGRASLLMAYVLGQWQRFVLSGFKEQPGQKLESDMVLLLAA